MRNSNIQLYKSDVGFLIRVRTANIIHMASQINNACPISYFSASQEKHTLRIKILNSEKLKGDVSEPHERETQQKAAMMSSLKKC